MAMDTILALSANGKIKEMNMSETTEPVDNRAQEIMCYVFRILGELAGALSRPEILSIIQAGTQENGLLRSDLTFLRDKLNAALADELPRVQH